MSPVLVPQALDPVGALVLVDSRDPEADPIEVRFTTDPESWSFPWQKNATMFSGIGGWNAIQAWPTVLKDAQITCGSGGSSPLDFTTMRTLKAMALDHRAVYGYRDPFGNEGSVYILAFDERFRSAGAMWDYTLALSVRALSKFYGGDVPSYIYQPPPPAP